MLDKLIEDFNAKNGKDAFHRTPLRWRRIMVESVDSSKTYEECIRKVKTNIEGIKLASF